MSEKFSLRIEQDNIPEQEESQEKSDGISEREKKDLESIITGILDEDFDRDADYVLSKYIEKGQELSPQKKASLRKAIEIMLGIKVSKDE